jgi:Ca2+-binding EF-hand superfamily protein
MLVGISLLTSSPAAIMKPKLSTSRRQAMFAAVDHGAKWTLSHFLKTIGKAESETKGEKFTFETFANWYTNGGFNVAPWLELLDLSKLLSLVTEMEEGVKSPVFESPPVPRESLPTFPASNSFTPKYHSPRHHSPRRSRYGAPVDPFAPPPPPPQAAEVLFTFPLANQRSLVVLREDATYVRGVVEQLGLLMRPPDDVWKSLFSFALKRPPLAPNHGAKPPPKSSLTKSMLVNKVMFVECMQSTISAGSSSKKRSAGGISKAAAGARDVLANFFHSFDLHQIDRVALNELMGGLTLLCGGKKSTKLAFAFGVFDHRIQLKQKKGKSASPLVNSLGGEDLFLFLRSFLIVMFSCCRQSWDLSDDAVGRYIADTANMVTDDVMRYQWRTRKRDRVDFDDFGEWYNEGGFETAPWLELLDLKKWVLKDDAQKVATPRPPPKSPSTPGLPPLSSSRSHSQDYDCPPPPPEDSLDPSFFADDDDDNGIMPMDSIDEMDIILMQSHDHDDPGSHEKLSRSFSYTQSPKQSHAHPPAPSVNSLKFHLVTDDGHGGYMVSVSQKRIRHLRHILMESGLHRIDGETACKQILGKSFQAGKSSRHSSLSLTKNDFDAAMRGIVSGRTMSVETQRTLSEVLGGIFSAFDHNRDGTVNAVEVACGFTVLCKGKKSDKLEYAFEVLDRDKRGKLSKSDTARYLRSFLTVLLNIASTPSLDSDLHEDSMATMSGAQCDRSAATQSRAVEAGSSWASGQAFKGRSTDLICFDEFAEWYTHVGYSNIPWLELLDLHKWVVMDS